MLLNPRLAGLTESCPAFTPVPDNGTLTDVPLLYVMLPPCLVSTLNAIETPPLAAPADCGLNAK
jgi:hypothetical protein